MSTPTTGDSYYIRIRGKVLGPYSVKQLSILRQRGQFSQSNEISKNGQDWESAARLDEVFAASAKPKSTKATDGQDSFAISSSQGEAIPWHYSINNQQLGPATTAELKGLLETGQLSASDLVWREGMSDWVPVADVPELKRYISSAKTLRRNQLENVASDESEPIIHHFLDYVVEGLRGLFPASSLKHTFGWGIEIGKYTVYVSIVLNLAYGFLVASKTNSLDIGLLAVGYSILVLSAQYAGVKCCRAIALLLEDLTFRVSSRAYFDSLVILMLMSGPVFLTASAVAAIRLDSFGYLAVGFLIFIECEAIGLRILHPDAMGIRLSNDVRAGENAIAIIAFNMMLPLRAAAGIFAGGVVISTIGTIGAIYLFTQTTREAPVDALALSIPTALVCGAIALGSCLYPFLVYVYFLMTYLFIDVMKSILEVPLKLDCIAKILGRANEGT